MIRVTNKSECCGCTACFSICKHDAISMDTDALGFTYPIVNLDKCIDCGICEKVCSFNDHYDTSNKLSRPLIFGVRHREINEIMRSRSGAVFVAISDYIIESGGVVYGVGYTDDLQVIHKRATTKEERDEFRGSKYVKSDVNVVFRQVFDDLRNGLFVLFSGTPCQCAGLNSFIKSEYKENLFLVDIVCHGTPSPNIWSDYKHYIEKKYHSKIINFNFRDKKKVGWKGHVESAKFQNGKYISVKHWTYLFYQNIMQMKACANCHFCNMKRPSDITLADFWSWEKAAPGFNKDDKGASLVLCNSSKGLDLFKRCANNFVSVSVDINDCIQPNMKEPSSEHPKRDAFEQEYVERGFKYVYFKYGDEGWRYKLKPVILRKRLKSLIRKILIIIGVWKPREIVK